MAQYFKVCRFCRDRTCANNAISLFSKSGYKQKLPARISTLLEISLTEDDDLPKHICQKCKRRLESLERSALDLKNFKELVIKHSASSMRGPLKRTKETSGASNISPSTLRARPSPKRLSSARQLCFGKILCSSNLKMLSVLHV